MAPAIKFVDAMRFWLKLGFISFGGPAGQIAIMHRELVEQRHWISEKRFLHALNYCMVLPGPEAQQLATYIGWLMHGAKGGIVAGALFVLPSLAILIALSWLYLAFGQHPLAASLLYGIKPAVTAIVVAAAWRIGGKALKNGLLWAIAAASLLAIALFNVPFPAVIFGAALLGAAGGLWLPHYFSGHSTHTGSVNTPSPAIIGDDSPTPDHAKFHWRRLGVCLVVAGVLWCVPMGVLIASSGWQGTLAQMGWFFTKAALLTFGGAYAVLPYVFQGAVEHFAWLSAGQMIDGLALGETTPGPLIMVVAFVGFVGGWNHAVAGTQSLALGGAIAACVVTWYTFLPSFIFIFLGGPIIETTHGQLRFTAPLTAITAAVVGVIINLALFFAWHVWWPQATPQNPFGGPFEWFAVLLTFAAWVALVRYKIGVVRVIVACALAGCLHAWLAL